MYHLDNSSGVDVMPELANKESASTKWFTSRTPTQVASYPGADWFNIVQAELLNVLTEANITPDKTKLNQISQAIRQVVSDNAPPSASTEVAGTVKLNNTVTSISTTEAATANAVKTAYDRGSLGVTNAAAAQTAANNAQNTANSAKTTADAAQTTANNAQSTANSAKTEAEKKLSLTGGTMTTGSVIAGGFENTCIIFGGTDNGGALGTVGGSNINIRSWYGIGFINGLTSSETYNQTTIGFDVRNGKVNSHGGYFKNGIESLYTNQVVDSVTSTSTTAPASANSVKVAYDKGVEALNKANTAAAGSGLGYGQTWQNVTASRSKGVTYTNSTGKPIFVLIGVNTSVVNGSITLTINGITFKYNIYSHGTPLSFIVTQNGTYNLGGNLSITSWIELR